ncbi:hypothetical protein KY284_012863 [Solanum tuberosum]|nr:hypothetical protein KY284_012863 [Solanum tuberosum]
MAGQNDEHFPFIRFPDAASRERHHDNRNTGFYCEMGIVLHKLEGAGDPETCVRGPTKGDRFGVAKGHSCRAFAAGSGLRDTAEGNTSTDWSPDAKRWLQLVTRRIWPSGNHTDVTFPRVLVVACAIQGIQLSVGAQIISYWKMLYQGNKKAFFLPGLITALYKRAGVPLFDTDEVLPMDPPLHPLLVRSGSTSRSKRRRTSRASSSRAAAGSDDEDPLSGAWVEEDLEVVRERMGSAYTKFTSVPLSTSLEVEILRK